MAKPSCIIRTYTYNSLGPGVFVGSGGVFLHQGIVSNWSFTSWHDPADCYLGSGTSPLIMIRKETVNPTVEDLPPPLLSEQS